MICAFVLSSLIAFTYDKTSRDVATPSDYIQSLVLIAIVAAMIMLAIGNSLARGSGMLGALAIIRFKTTLKNSQAVLDKLLKLEGADPLDILDIKEIIIKKEQKSQQIDLQILNTYVEWLAISNKMMERPLQNHLVAKPSVLPLDIWLNN